MTEIMQIQLTCKAFSTEAARRYTLDVSADRTIRVLDDVSGQYTRCHALSARAAKRAWAMTYGPGR